MARFGLGWCLGCFGGEIAMVGPPRAAVSWKGPGEPVVLTVYGPNGEVALPLLGD